MLWGLFQSLGFLQMFQALQEKRAIQNHLSRTSLCPKHDARFINVKLFDIHQNSICEEPRGSYYYNKLTEMFLCLELYTTVILKQEANLLLPTLTELEGDDSKDNPNSKHSE